MKASKRGTETYLRPFGLGYLNPRLNKKYIEMDEEQAENFAVYLGHIEDSPDPDEEMEGTWHVVRKPIGFIHHGEKARKEASGDYPSGCAKAAEKAGTDEVSL
jgi:hypothetical protein